MNPEIEKFLYDIWDASVEIDLFLKNISFRKFMNNKLLQAAIERKFEIIGEALNRIKRIDSEFIENFKEHHRIIGFRNIIAHGYDVIDQEMVWAAVKKHLPLLKQEVSEFIKV